MASGAGAHLEVNVLDLDPDDLGDEWGSDDEEDF